MKEGRYQYLDKIGEGGMATVYLGIQRSLDRQVAIKVLDASLSDNPSVIKRFKRESLIIARLNHPNIIHVIDKGTTSNGRPVFVMEYVDGINLADAILEGRYDFNEKVDIAVQICKGLAYAHKLDVIHRDIKPANVLVDQEGHARLLDFGIASFFEKDADEHDDETRLILGTEAYMAPEQHQGISETSKLSDIYSLGVMLFELFTGHLPGVSPADELQENASLSESVAKLILSCISVRPDNRPESVEEIKTKLLLAMQGQHIAPDQANRAGEGMSAMASKFGLLDVMREDKHGAAYLYEDKASHKLMVIKKQADGQKGFRESKLMCSLKHPNWVDVLGASKNNDKFIVVMDYVSGGSLQDRLAAPVAFDTFLPVAIQIAKGLAFAHQNRLIHGNLRPSNVLLTAGMQVKLSDFGFDEHYRVKSEDRNWYADGRANHDELGDIYAMGAVFYHALTSFPPKVKEDRLVKSKYFLELPEDVQVLIERMLSPDPDRRPQSAEAVVSELLPFLENQSTLVKTQLASVDVNTETVIEYRHRRGWLLFCSLLLCASLALNVLLLGESGDQIRQSLNQQIDLLFNQIEGTLFKASK